MASYYVDQINGDDSTGNGTSSNPWLTIQKALDVSDASARTIYVRGSNTGTPALPRVEFKTTSSHNYTTCDIIGCDADWNPVTQASDARPLVTVQDSSWTIYSNWRTSPNLITIKNLRFANPLQTANYMISLTGNATNGDVPFRFENCRFIQSNSACSGLFYSAAFTSYTRTVEFINCDVDASASGMRAQCVINSCVRWSFRNGSIIQNLTTSPCVISPIGSVGVIDVSGSTLQANTFAETLNVTAVTGGAAFSIRGCTFTGCNLATVPKYFALVVIRDNRLNVVWSSLTFVILIGNSDESEANPVGMAVVINNIKTIDETGTPPAGAHYVMVGMKIPGIVAYNQFVQKYTLAADVDYGLVIKGNDVTVFWNWFAAKLAIYAVGCQRCKFLCNTAVSMSSGPASSAFGMTLTAGGSQYPMRNVVLNNIFVSINNSRYTFSGLAGGLGPTYWAASNTQQYFNYNIYYCEGTNSVYFAQLETSPGAGGCNNIAELRAAWAANANAELFPDNESYGDSYNPMIGGLSEGGWKTGSLEHRIRPPLPLGSDTREIHQDIMMPYSGAGNAPTQIRYVGDLGIESWQIVY